MCIIRIVVVVVVVAVFVVVAAAAINGISHLSALLVDRTTVHWLVCHYSVMQSECQRNRTAFIKTMSSNCSLETTFTSFVPTASSVLLGEDMQLKF